MGLVGEPTAVRRTLKAEAKRIGRTAAEVFSRVALDRPSDGLVEGSAAWGAGDNDVGDVAVDVLKFWRRRS